MKLFSESSILNTLRLGLSFILLWAFFDKLIGLGFATTPEKSWLSGVSPTAGFLSFGTHGFFAPIFQSISGNILVDVLFMLGLLLIGLCLLFGIGMKIACISGSVLMLLLYLSVLPFPNNPFIDEHIIYMLVFLLLGFKSTNSTFGLSNRWREFGVVKRHPILL